MKKLIIVFSLLLLLTACVTPYQPETITRPIAGGYSEMKLNDDLYKVRFRGNANTSKVDVEKMFLRRCAELTKQNGYKYFYIAGTDEADKRRMANIINQDRYKDYLLIQTKRTQPDRRMYISQSIIRMSNKKLDYAVNAETFLRNFATNS